jgi:hypothetical protein
MWHFDYTTIFPFPKPVILKRWNSIVSSRTFSFPTCTRRMLGMWCGRQIYVARLVRNLWEEFSQKVDATSKCRFLILLSRFLGQALQRVFKETVPSGCVGRSHVRTTHCKLWNMPLKLPWCWDMHTSQWQESMMCGWHRCAVCWGFIMLSSLMVYHAREADSIAGEWCAKEMCHALLCSNLWKVRSKHFSKYS